MYLRTVGGLQRVDAIVRRVDSAYCDPAGTPRPLPPRRARPCPGRAGTPRRPR
ncbi:MAG: hypothetical protein IPK12_24245 [Gemmatimonadetes bacterium]|nr:hypothetical protein [Gemmatimonadota bacterium]